MTGDQAQAVRDLFAQSIELGIPMTSRVLAAIPDGNRDYKPDPKSRSAWELATHLATADVWFLDSIARGEFARSRRTGPPEDMASPETVAAWYGTHLQEKIAELRAMTPEELLKPMTFVNGSTQPAVTWLVAMLSHSMHHRGQLAAYLRPAGGKVPAIFGMSADENAFA
jgi:uncharacterized damage-inducible protein DinB